MAPDPSVVNSQTELVICYLLADEDEIHSRMLDASNVETDGPDDSFDPVLVADKLRTIADALNDDPRFIAALTDLKQAAANEALVAAFSQGVETVCESHVSQGAEVAPEMKLIRASVAFGLYVKKISPDLKGKVQNAMVTFLNNRVGSWVAKQGGWDKVPVS